MKGKKITWGDKISKATKGRKAWNKDVAWPKEIRKKIQRNTSRALKKKWQDPEFRKRMSEANKGEKCHWWQGGRYKSNRGYIHIYSSNHPNTSKSGYIVEHRLIMEKYLGRYLEKNEFVHHKNGIKDDNRVENLEIKTRNIHRGRVKCPFCRKEFLIE